MPGGVQSAARALCSSCGKLIAEQQVLHGWLTRCLPSATQARPGRSRRDATAAYAGMRPYSADSTTPTRASSSSSTSAQPQATPNTASEGTFITLSGEQTATGYPESHLGKQQQEDRLRIPLPSRAPLHQGDADADAAPAVLTAEERRTLSKFVGVLTKEGKRSRARRMLLGAMQIIKQELRQSAQQQAATGSSGGAKGKK